MSLTVEDFRRIMPRCPHPETYATALWHEMREAEISTVTRAAAFLAQLAHESGECRYLEELGDGWAYEGRADLGNTEKGDGPRYKGRGLIQLTGRRNYRLAGPSVGLDLELHPEQAADPAVACGVAVWYWSTHGCNELADACDFHGITKVINGGYNGLTHREKYYHRALEILGARAKMEAA